MSDPTSTLPPEAITPSRRAGSPRWWVLGAATASVAAALLAGAGMSGMGRFAPAMIASAHMAPPEPDPIPRRWQLDVEVGPLRVATFDVKEGGKRSYFYLTYTVTNNSGEDLLFAPSFELAMDSKVIRSGRNVPLEVTKQLIQKSRIPQINDQIAIIGQLLQGKENRKQGLVIWTADDMQTSDLVIYAAGFSGETATVERPDTKAKVILRKTLRLRYAAPGDLTQNRQDTIPLAEPSRWIMR